MPVPMRGAHHRPDAKYNVTTDFPSLGLHSAASTGNVGLVEYALSRGQPVNSVVDGVLPLHAACAGGNVQVVKLLIEYGADVNAPRLPKRYSSRDSSAPIIGTTGSTPLHFAAANGNRDAIMLLLLHGAHANRADKHGVTPESLARQNGWIECADLLRNWIINKDKDLREREPFIVEDKDQARHRNRLYSGDLEPSILPRRRLQVKHSIDTALNMIRSSSSNLAETYKHGRHTPTPPTSPQRPFGDFSSQLGQNPPESVDPNSRRPSLPHVLQSDALPRSRKISSHSAHTHRPRSAGSGSEENERLAATTTHNKGGTARRLGSKVSLLNLFRKGQTSEGINTPDITGPSDMRSQSRLHSDVDVSIKLRRAGGRSLERKPSLTTPSHSPLPTAVDLHNALAQEQQRITNRDRSRSNASSRYEHLNEDNPMSNGVHHSPGTSPLTRIGILRNQGHNRTRSGSGSSSGYEVSVPSRLGLGTTLDESPHGRSGSIDSENVSKSLPRSSILRPHNRSGSNGQGQMTPSALRALRFDLTSTGSTGDNANADRYVNSRDGPSPRNPPAKLKQSSSAGSLARADSWSRRRASRRPGSAGSIAGNSKDDNEGDTAIEERDDEEEEYGQPIQHMEPHSLLIGINNLASSSRASLSPITSNDHTSGEGDDALAAEFPFSINRPPPVLTDTVGNVAAPPHGIVDGRHRGDSMSSIGSMDSHMISSLSNNTNGTATTSTPSSDTLPQPDMQEGVVVTGPKVIDVGDEDQTSHNNLLRPPHGTTSSHRRPPPLPLQPLEQEHSLYNPPPSLTMSSSNGSLSGRRSHTPFDIDISSISTHAQAEALVEKARKEVMELASVEGQDVASVTDSNGRTPLSARLAVYGESLILEKKFRELEKNGGSTVTSAGGLLTVGHQRSRNHSAYASSLQSGKSTGGMQESPRKTGPNSGNPKRPSTAEGLASRDANISLSSDHSDKSSRSASVLGYRKGSEGINNKAQIPVLSLPSSSDGEDGYTSRSRTPTGDHDRKDMSLSSSYSRMVSLDGTGYGDDEFGTSLFRVSTAPSPVRLTPSQAQGRSLKKLAKMGISVADQVANSGSSPHLHPNNGKRFGAIRHLFKGKT